MSREENNPSGPSNAAAAAANRRRSSFTANKLSEMFNSTRNPTSSSNSPPPQSSPVFPNAAAARRLSVSGALGLNSANSSAPNSATVPSAGSMWGLRRGSMSTSAGSNGSSGEDSAIDESGDALPAQPPSPLGRRMSFGARAMGQMRQNEGFNWAENIRNRQSRSGSTPTTNITSSSAARNEQMKAQQEKMVQPPKSATPPAPAPKKERPAPDHFQERILKGDFYMD